MSCVFLAAGSMAASGCSNTDLSRFAPPGIVKYEEIASEKPQNPEVAARIAERRAQQGGERFPNLSQTPGPEDKPKKPSSGQISAEMAALQALRENLAEEVAEDRAAAEAELAGDLQAEREVLSERVESDSRAAARERREKLTAPAAPDEPDRQ